MRRYLNKYIQVEPLNVRITSLNWYHISMSSNIIFSKLDSFKGRILRNKYTETLVRDITSYTSHNNQTMYCQRCRCIKNLLNSKNPWADCKFELATRFWQDETNRHDVTSYSEYQIA